MILQRTSLANMGILALKGLFHKDSVNDYQNVLVPLEKAQRHSTVEAEYARRRSAEGVGSNGGVEGKKEDGLPNSSESSGEEGTLHTSGATYSPYSIDGLRAEVMEDVAGSGYNSAYDCELFWSPECPGG